MRDLILQFRYEILAVIFLVAQFIHFRTRATYKRVEMLLDQLATAAEVAQPAGPNRRTRRQLKRKIRANITKASRRRNRGTGKGNKRSI